MNIPFNNKVINKYLHKLVNERSLVIVALCIANSP